MPRIKPGPPCAICGLPSIARGLCDKHYRRWRRHGHTEQTRPLDWGQKSKHPLWNVWKWTKRVGRVHEWNDFWVFARDVGDKPAENSILRRRDTSQPASPGNCYWGDPIVTSEADYRKSRAEYAREWRKRNPHKAKNSELKKMFGIGIAEYEEMLVSQEGKCAICGQRDEHFSLAVDHCHDKGQIRGLLCSQCNRGLGLFKDSPDLLLKAAEYLRWPKRLV